MSKTMWRITTYSNKLEPVEVIRETEKTLFYRALPGGEMRQRKGSDWQPIFPTRIEALAWKVNLVTEKLRSAKIVVSSLEGELGNVKGLLKAEPRA